MKPDPEVTRRIDVARRAAREAGALTLRHFHRADLEVEWKPDASPVTVADREAELLLRARLAAAFPGDGVLGEEFGEEKGNSGYRFILDPIDGTKSFVHGVPLYGNMVGLERDRKAVAGVVYFPGLDEELWAQAGSGAWFLRSGDTTPAPARVSKVDRLEEALFLATSVSAFEAAGQLEVHERLRRAVRLARGWSDCYAYALVATGRAEFVVDPGMHLWDCAALAPILEEAGGCFTDWDGTPTIYAERTIGSNGRILGAVLAVTRGRGPTGSGGSRL